jgi:hypothetical protein
MKLQICALKTRIPAVLIFAMKLSMNARAARETVTASVACALTMHALTAGMTPTVATMSFAMAQKHVTQAYALRETIPAVLIFAMKLSMNARNAQQMLTVLAGSAKAMRVLTAEMILTAAMAFVKAIYVLRALMILTVTTDFFVTA